MSIESILASPDQRNPIYLVEFQQGLIYYRYTTADEDVIFNTFSYVRAAVTVAKTQRSLTETPGGTSTVQLSSDDPVVKIFDAFLPVEPVVCRVRHMEQNDTTASSRLIVSGQITNVVDNDDGTSTLTIKPFYEAFNRASPWQAQQATCVLVLYGLQCGVNADSYKITAEGLTTLDGLTLSASEWDTQDATYFQAGFVKCRRTGEVRFINEQNDGGTLTISYPFLNALTSDIFDAYAGCQRTGDICKNKFNNKINFMGFEDIPTTNLFKSGVK